MTPADLQTIAEAANAAGVEVLLTPYGWRVRGERFEGSTSRMTAQRSIPFQLVDKARFNVLLAEIDYVARVLARQIEAVA